MTPEPIQPVHVERKQCWLCGCYTAESITVLANAFNSEATTKDGWLDQVIQLPVCLAHFPQIYSMIEIIRKTSGGSAAMQSLEAKR